MVSPIVGFCVCSIFWCTLLCVLSSFAIILMWKRELVALLCLPSWCLEFEMCDCGISLSYSLAFLERLKATLLAK